MFASGTRPRNGSADVVGRGQVHAHGGQGKVRRDRQGVAFVLGIAVTREQDTCDRAGGGHLRKPGHEGRIDPAAQSDNETPGAGRRQPRAHPKGDFFGLGHRRNCKGWKRLRPFRVLATTLTVELNC